MEKLSYSTAVLGLTDDVGPIYCHTSFAVEVFMHRLQNIGAAPSPGKYQARITAAAHFFYDAKQAGHTFVTSALAIHDAFRLLAFYYVDEDILASKGKHASWRDYRTVDAAGFQASLDAGRRLTLQFDLFLKETEIDVLAHGRQPAGRPPVLEAHIVADARMFATAFPGDVSLCFHYATMLRFGIEIAACSDPDWEKFSVGKVVTD